MPGSHLLSHAVARIVPSAVKVLTVVFGMGTGVSPSRIATGQFIKVLHKRKLRRLEKSSLFVKRILFSFAAWTRSVPGRTYREVRSTSRYRAISQSH